MPLSRTRSLLANINGVANGANGSVHVTNGGSSTANTPGSETNGYALPSINGSSDHLPPLKANGAAQPQAITNGGGSVASNNNKFFNGGSGTVNGSVNGVNGTSLTSNGYLFVDNCRLVGFYSRHFYITGRPRPYILYERVTVLIKVVGKNRFSSCY